MKELFTHEIDKLTEKWTSLQDDYFDLETFKTVCNATIRLFYNLRNDSSLSKDAVYLLLQVNRFAESQIIFQENRKICNIVAHALCEQAVDPWLSADCNEPDPDKFVVPYGRKVYVIDLNTFDLSELAADM